MEILRITDGQTEVSFLSGDYHLLAWSPAVARRADNLLEPSPFRNVTERMTIAVKDYEKMQTLAQLLDRAQRWQRGEDTRPVRLEYKLTSASVVLVALIVGVGGSMIGLPTIYSLSEATGLVDNVTIDFERQGEWLTPDPTNLIVNGSFENWTGSDPDDWTIVGATVVEENTIVTAGAASADITSSEILETSIYQTVTVEIGLTYRVSGWLYLVSGKAATLEIRQLSSAVTRVSSLVVGDWQYVEQIITSSDDELSVYLLSVNGVAQFYADDIRVVAVDASGEPGDVATDTAVANGDLASLNFGTGQEKYHSPTKVTITDFRTGLYHPRAFLIVANGTEQITLVDSDDFGWLISAPFANVADSAAFARGGNVTRLTPAGTSAYRLSVKDYDLNFYNIRRVGIFANVRNNSTTTQFTMQAASFAPGGTSYARPIVVPGAATPSPEWVYLGAVTFNRDGAFFIDITASAASGTLDIDTVVLVALDKKLSIIAIDQSENVGISEPGDLIANHHTLTEQSPKVEIIQNGIVTAWSARGDIAIYTDAPEIEAVLLATGGDTGVNFWRQVASSAVIENDWTASRLPGRLVAE